MDKNCFQMPRTKAGVTYNAAALDAAIVGGAHRYVNS